MSMTITIKVWRQKSANEKGHFERHVLNDVLPGMSFLEMLDTLNNRLILEGKDPVAFESDCREGICGTCGLVINGEAHGPSKLTATCQLHMRSFKDDDVIVIEPWRAKAFPVVKDLVVDRSSFDRIIQAGGYVSINAGSAPDGNTIPISKEVASEAFDAAACIGCGACVASCKNASAMLFTSAKISQLALLPQGQPERYGRVQAMVSQMDAEHFGNCTNETECEAQCPKGISVKNIARMNREYLHGKLLSSL